MTLPMIRMDRGPGQGMHGWIGPWPPPEELLCCVGKTTGEIAFSEETILKRKGIDRELVELHATIFIYRRANYSTLPDEVDAMENVFRGADYRLVGDEPSFTCPKCGMTSYNANDIAHGYCGNCHEFTGTPTTEVRP